MFVLFQALTRIAFPLCQNVRGPSGLPFFIHILEWGFLAAGVTLLFGMVILLLTAIVYVPLPEIFILGIFLVAILDILINVVNAIEVAPKDHGCKMTIVLILYKIRWLKKFYMIPYMLEALFKAAFNMYFAVVVNSYAEQVERLRPDKVICECPKRASDSIV
ncbi:hypothetical protein O0L34_g10818 [Tuta absoluta]|nr:hypothetical protein O0L34_g10818 [Tuta absoluta]